jgi:hypothetical protein
MIVRIRPSVLARQAASNGGVGLLVALVMSSFSSEFRWTFPIAMACVPVVNRFPSRLVLTEEALELRGWFGRWSRQWKYVSVEGSTKHPSVTLLKVTDRSATRWLGDEGEREVSGKRVDPRHFEKDWLTGEIGRRIETAQPGLLARLGRG